MRILRIPVIQFVPVSVDIGKFHFHSPVSEAIFPLGRRNENFQSAFSKAFHFFQGPGWLAGHVEQILFSPFFKAFTLAEPKHTRDPSAASSRGSSSIERHPTPSFAEFWSVQGRRGARACFLVVLEVHAPRERPLHLCRTRAAAARLAPSRGHRARACGRDGAVAKQGSCGAARGDRNNRPARRGRALAAWAKRSPGRGVAQQRMIATTRPTRQCRVARASKAPTQLNERVYGFLHLEQRRARTGRLRGWLARLSHAKSALGEKRKFLAGWFAAC